MEVRVACIGCLLVLWWTVFAQGADDQPQGGTLPPSMPQEQASWTLKVISSETWSLKGNRVTGTKVEFEYRGYRAKADNVEGDLETNVFTLLGHVNIVSADSIINAKSVSIDFDDRTFSMTEGEVVAKPALLKGKTRDDFYMTTQRLSGGDTLIDGRVGTVTSCDYDDPHYQFESVEYLALPEKRLTFKHFRLKILGKTVFSIPRMDIPIDRRSRDFLPDVGHSPEEGYYAKFKIPVAVKKDLLLVRTDIMTRLGVGLGGDYLYESSKTKGRISAYTNFKELDGALRYTAGVSHMQQLSFGSVDGSYDIRRFSFLDGPTVTVSESKLQFLPNLGGQGSTRLYYTSFFNEAGQFTSEQSTVGFTDVRKWGANHSTSVQVAWNKNRATLSGIPISSREVLDIRFQDVIDFKKFTTQLDFNKTVPIGSVTQFSGVFEKVPDFSIRTDSKRLFGPNAKVPEFSFLGAVGNYVDASRGLEVGRYFFEIKTRKTGLPRQGFGLEYDAGFRQGFYSDNTAQYTPSANVRLSYNSGRKLSANLRYNYARQHGFTPLPLDRGGRYHTLSFDILGEPLPGVKLGGQSGYDFNRERQGQIAWQSPSLRLEYEPNSLFRFRALATYDVFRKSWGSFRFDGSAQIDGVRMTATAYFDGFRNRWGNVNFFIDGLRWGRLGLTALLLYNGFLKRFDTTILSLTYDMHCTEAVLQVMDNKTGLGPGQQIVFFIRIKALPFGSPLGPGLFGQPGVGRSFGGF